MSSDSPILDPIRVGILGLNFGELMSRRISEGVSCLKIVALCDLDAVKLQRVAAELKVKAYGELDAMLADPEIEALVVFTGCVGRAKLVSKILKAGKHVLTTKPFELNAADTAAVMREAQQLGKVVHLNSPGPQPSEDVALIQRWMSEQDLGRPLAFHAKVWANYREKANGTWYDDPDKCAAAPILRLGVYFLNEFASFLGEPESVYVIQSRIFTQRPTVDHALMSIRFANGALGSIFGSFCIDDGHPWRDEITLNFERGTVNRWVQRHDASNMGADYAVSELWKNGHKPIQGLTRPGAFAGWYQWDNFYRAVRAHQGTSARYAEQVHNGVRLLQAMRASALSGKPEPV